MMLTCVNAVTWADAVTIGHASANRTLRKNTLTAEDAEIAEDVQMILNVEDE